MIINNVHKVWTSQLWSRNAVSLQWQWIHVNDQRARPQCVTVLYSLWSTSCVRVCATHRVSDASAPSCVTSEIASSSRTTQIAVFRATSTFSKTRTRLRFQIRWIKCRLLPQTSAVRMWTPPRGRCTADSERHRIVQLLPPFSPTVHVDHDLNLVLRFGSLVC